MVSLKKMKVYHLKSWEMEITTELKVLLLLQSSAS